jgi:hypothetical protein
MCLCTSYTTNTARFFCVLLSILFICRDSIVRIFIGNSCFAHRKLPQLYRPKTVVYHKYRVSQEERPIFWEVIVSVILSKNVYTNMCSYKHFCLEWPILWPPRILTFLLGTLCICRPSHKHLLVLPDYNWKRKGTSFLKNTKYQIPRRSIKLESCFSMQTYERAGVWTDRRTDITRPLLLFAAVLRSRL